MSLSVVNAVGLFATTDFHSSRHPTQPTSRPCRIDVETSNPYPYELLTPFVVIKAAPPWNPNSSSTLSLTLPLFAEHLVPLVPLALSSHQLPETSVLSNRGQLTITTKYALHHLRVETIRMHPKVPLLYTPDDRGRILSAADPLHHFASTKMYLHRDQPSLPHPPKLPSSF